jgi:cell division protein FtsI (penicillin-binding protein 3)
MKPVNFLDRKRLVFLSVSIFILFSLLIAQFYRIQIVEGDKWTHEAMKQHFFVVQEPFLRGTFYSNTNIKKGHPEITQRLVVDIQKFHLYIDPESIPPKHRKPISTFLLSKLDLSTSEHLDFKKQFSRKSRSRKLAMWLDQETRDTIMNWWLPYAKKHKIPRNALFFVNDYQRSYPFGKLLGQVLHTVQGNKDEVTKQAVPTGGLELYFNTYLQGKQGKRRLKRSPRNAFETGEVTMLPQNGADIYLTINHCLQAIAEEEIAKGVKKAKAKTGVAVMMDPYTGEILALAQYPFFYPPDYQYYFNNKELIEHTCVKAITDANEPGSVMKPLTLAIALKANEVLKARGEKPIFNPTDKTDTSNSHFAGRASKPLKDTSFHHYLNMEMALQKSSNIYVARLVESIIARLGKDWYRSVLQDTFGFGLKTHIELPAESPGVLPTPGKKHPNGALEWSQATPYSLAIGHNVQATCLQIVRAIAVIANGGYLVQPTLVKKIVKTLPDGTQELLKDNAKSVDNGSFPHVLSPEIVSSVLKCMKFATKQGGTAPKANVWGYSEAGKTGTAAKIVNGTYSDQYVASFVGFTPASKSAFVLLVMMDEPEYGYVPGLGKNHHGGNCCAPVFREIAIRALEYLGIAPDDPYGYPKGDPRHNSDKADWLPETQRLKEMYDSWNNGISKENKPKDKNK